jgi:hypothetical protein
MTAGDIRKALEATYKSPEWYLGFEVGNSTGANCRRHADAIAINAYPSKGFETRGFEIKVSKQDLTAELKNGLKSDEIARFCDYWFLVVPKGLTDGFTLPPTWGVIECHDGKLRQKVRATKLESIAPTAGFLCAMLRARERMLFDEAIKISAEREEQILRNAKWQAGRDSEQLRQMREKLDAIKEATGISLDNWTPTADIIAKLNAARSLDTIVRNVRFVESAAKALLKDAQEIQAAAEAMKMPDLAEG